MAIPPNNGKMKIVPSSKFHTIPCYTQVSEQGELGGFKKIPILYKPYPEVISKAKDDAVKERLVRAFHDDPAMVVDRTFYRALLPLQGAFVAVWEDVPSAPRLFWIHQSYLMSMEE